MILFIDKDHSFYCYTLFCLFSNDNLLFTHVYYSGLNRFMKPFGEALSAGVFLMIFDWINCHWSSRKLLHWWEYWFVYLLNFWFLLWDCSVFWKSVYIFSLLYYFEFWLYLRSDSVSLFLLSPDSHAIFCRKRIKHRNLKVVLLKPFKIFMM